eukprot:Rhum_TRINITY_DN14433_c37_g1::Rhum_TRINITY_DN14433_c37_g1_i1::g.91424::m.91424
MGGGVVVFFCAGCCVYIKEARGPIARALSRPLPPPQQYTLLLATLAVSAHVVVPIRGSSGTKCSLSPSTLPTPTSPSYAASTVPSAATSSKRTSSSPAGIRLCSVSLKYGVRVAACSMCSARASSSHAGTPPGSRHPYCSMSATDSPVTSAATCTFSPSPRLSMRSSTPSSRSDRAAPSAFAHFTVPAHDSTAGTPLGASRTRSGAIFDGGGGASSIPPSSADTSDAGHAASSADASGRCECHVASRRSDGVASATAAAAALEAAAAAGKTGEEAAAAAAAAGGTHAASAAAAAAAAVSSSPGASRGRV